MAYDKIKIPAGGEKITMGSDGKLTVPNHPIVPFIEGDGTGPDIWRSSVRVLDAAVAKAWKQFRAAQTAKVMKAQLP